MSARGAKKRGRPPKVQIAERNKKFQYQLLKKPKYLQNLNRGSDSPTSTPSASRASSPQVEAPKGRRGARTRGKRRGANTSGPYQRRGYNPHASDYHDSEYHYGSDFGDDSSEKSDPEDDVALSASDSEESVGAECSDSDFSLSSYSTVSGTVRRPRPPTPEPIWLQNVPIPPLDIPKSSDDLMVPKSHIMAVVSIYEVIRHFRNLVRLSPFRLEDFCNSITSEDQSNLFAEVHIMLLKALLREEDSQQTHFAPLDQKDSVNISLYLIDYVTWPEALRSYVESDSNFDQNVMNLLNTTEYPYTSLENRILVLKFLTDQFLTTNPVRDDLISEVPMHYDDHCRVCHKLGDLLCCETCPAVFHLECVDPPLMDVPEEDWQCNICRSHKVSGVVDCVLDIEKQGQLCRQEHLGFDRFGRKYYFLCRRIFVENSTENGDNEVWYYTTTLQFEELMKSLDADDLEADLCRELNDFRDEIIRQMQLTEKLTNQFKGNRKTYLEQENNLIIKAQTEPKDDEKMDAISSHDDSSSDTKDSASVTSTTTTTTVTTTTTTETKTEITTTKSNGENDEKAEDIVTRSKTGSLTPRTFNMEELRKRTSNMSSENERITRLKSMQIANGTFLYKLGMENQYKAYVNQFATNIIALNKPQRNEERDKKRHLSHKFSLTTASEFKWTGVTTGTKLQLLHTLRQTLIQLEQLIPPPFMHPNWHLLKKTWLNVVNQCQTAKDFAKALLVLQACIKPCVFATVWHEQLGHMKLLRVTAAEREERKKIEKREKKEREEEEERNRLIITTYVKYTMGFRHQLWKQKGEEYRIHGRWGWLWYSTARVVKFVNCSEFSLAAGPQKYMVQIRDKDNQLKIIGVTRDIYVFMKKNFQLDNSEIKEEVKEELSDESVKSHPDIPDGLKNLKIVRFVRHFEEINVSKALMTPGRILYPKVAKKSKLDDLLARRVLLKKIEERRLAVAKPEENPAPVKSEAESDDIDIEALDLDPNSPTPSTPTANKEALSNITKKIQQLRLHYTSISKLGKEYQCYSKACNISTSANSITSSCYSPICMQRNKVRKELLVLLRKANAHTNSPKLANLLGSPGTNNKKPTPLEQKLSEQLPELVKDPVIETTNLCEDLESMVAQATVCDEKTLSAMTPMENPPVHVKDEPFDCEDENEVNKDLNINPSPLYSFKEPEEEIVPEPVEIPVSRSKKSRKRDRKQAKVELENLDAVDVDMSPEDIKEMILGGGSKSKTTVVTTTTTTVTTSKTTTIDGVIKSESASRRSLKNDSLEISTVSNGRTIQTLNAQSSSTHYMAQYNRRFCAYKAVKREETKTDKTEDGVERVYSASTAEGKVYLKRVGVIGADKRKKKAMVKYPLCSTFATRKNTRSILILAKHEVRKLARVGGRIYVNGFNVMAKSNNLVWPYPCARPLFKTCWIYRTVNLKSLAAAALQLRIMWACMRWDDMQVKQQNMDGKHQITTETEILNLEILKHRHTGPFMERTQYLRRKVVIPLELPKTVREVTSIRSGLRKRKRPESPQSTDPQVTEEWVDEDKLELWEIKQYGEKLDRVNQQVITRSRTGNLPPARPGQQETADGGSPTKVLITTKMGAEDFKEKMEQQLRLQRAAHQQKRALELKNPQGIIKLGATQVAADGKIQAKNIVLASQGGKTLTSLLTNTNAGTPKQFAGRRIFMTKAADGTTRVVAANPTLIKGGTPQNLIKLQTTPTGNTIAVTTTPKTETPTNQQRVQIMRTSDGRYSVKGLMPGQQLVQMPDGKLQVLSTPTTAAQVVTSTPGITATPVRTTPTIAGSKIIKTASGKVILQPSVTKLAGSPAKHIIIKQQTPVSGQKAPTSTAVVVSGGTPVIQQQLVAASPVGSQPQIVVNNQNLAEQIATGKVQVATVNGQQVLIRPTGNNQAQIVAQLTPSTLGQVQQQQQTQAAAQVQQSATVQPQQVASPTKECAPVQQQIAQKVDNTIDPATMEQLLVGQPAGTVIKCVTAQVIQTPQGPRIVLQGLQGADFTPQQLAAVQQQVKQQLLKAQASTGKQAVLGPTKIYLAVQPNNAEATAIEPSQPPPLTPVKQTMVQQPVAQTTPVVQQVVAASPVTTQQTEQRQVLVNGQQQSSAILQAMKATMMDKSQTTGSSSTPSALAPAAVTTVTDANAAATVSSTPVNENKQFVVTPDYIQQTIRTALKQENLNPEIEEKLLQLQRYQEKQMKHDPPDAPVSTGRSTQVFRNIAPVNATRKRVLSASRVEGDDDDEWVMDTPKRPRPSRLVAELPKREVLETQHIEPKPISPRTKRIVKEITPEQKLANAKAKIAIGLFRHKEILKKEILRKRALLEKELQAEIQKEVSDELAARAKEERAKKEEVRSTSSNVVNNATPATANSRRKLAAPQTPTMPTLQKPSPPERSSKSGNRRSGGNRGSSSPSKNKKEKLYCVCQKPYDETKFYVGCDLCNNWFHGDCVGITEESSRSLSEFICTGCKHARETQELFCLCRQPYDESQFYICCDRCQDWFHGPCVGIMQSEADNIDEYVCPNCQRNSSVNYANMKNLNNRNFEELKRLMKQIQTHKSAWPFVEPVDPTEAPDYYKVIKAPMDLSKIDNKINERSYNKLSEFIGDMTKIFDNCRYYNPKESQFFKCAESLEAYFVNKIKSLREKLYDS